MKAKNNTEPAKWLVLQVGSRKEKIVSAALRSAGVECFVPLRDKHVEYASKRVVRQLPIVPGYVFVYTDRTRISTALSVPFAFGFLRTAGVYDSISDREVERLRLLCSNSLVRWSETPAAPRVQVGQLVEIVRGPLAGLRGYFLSHVNRNTFRITLGLIETQLTTCEVSGSDIVPLAGVGRRVR